MLTTILDSANHVFKCKSCHQNVYANQADEFMNQVYHKSCLKCKICSKPLRTFANEHQSSCATDLAYMDKNRDFICFDDLIRYANSKPFSTLFLIIYFSTAYLLLTN